MNVLIAVISNKPFEKFFHNSLLDLIGKTSMEHFVDVVYVGNCSIETMRNKACIYALGENQRKLKYDYLVQLDQDHIYPSDFIIKFLRANKEVMCGCTSRRTPPFIQTQYYKLDGNLTREDNLCNPKETDGLIKIEGTGAAGLMIKTSVLDKLKYPYFERIFLEDGEIISSDLKLCLKLKEKNIPIYCDSSVSFPHHLTCLFADRGKTVHVPN